MAATFPPLGWWWLTPIAYVPLLWCWRTQRPGVAALAGAVFGLIGFGIVCSWMWYFGVVAFFPFLIGMAAFPAITGYVTALLRAHAVRGTFIEAAVWVTFEGLRTRIPFGGMPWATSGVALAPFTPMRALAPLGGVLLASFIVIALNGVLLDFGTALRSRVPALRKRGLRQGGIGIALSVGVVVLATITWPHTAAQGPMRYALLQGNDLNRRLTPSELADNYLLESHFALADSLQGNFDLIVFPESALGGVDPETDAGVRARVIALAKTHNSWVMLNTNEEDGTATYNTNRVYAPDGQLVASYRKQHLVPFGEYVPLDWLRTVFPQLAQVGSGFSPGEGSVTVPIANHPLTTVICFESAFSALVRDASANGAQGIVLSTNNRSYRRSANSAQHLQLSQWRAAELGRPMLHAAISGISAAINERGEVEQRSALFERTTLQGDMITRSGRTLYARLGDWVLAACLLTTLIGVIVVLMRLRRAPTPGEPRS